MTQQHNEEMRPLWLLLILLLCHCSSKATSKRSYTIGIDPSWYPLHVAGRENNILAFSIELLTTIATVESLQISVMRMNWNNLIWGMAENKYHAILSTMRPYTFYRKQYAFSHPYLLTGPVIVLPHNIQSDQIEGKEIGVVRGSQAALMLQTTPNILIQGYHSIVHLFEALVESQIDGIALEVLAASSYISDLFPGQFRIASQPLNDMGLRLVSLFDKEPALMQQFNRGLKKLKKNGDYNKLLRKWGLLTADTRPQKDVHQQASAYIQEMFSHEPILLNHTH